MSQGGQGMFATEPAVTVIGSDGKMYNNPSAARAAGVYPEPVQLGGPAESYGQPTIGVPTLRSGMPAVDSSMFSTGMPTIGVPTLRSGNPAVDSSMFSNGVTYPNQPPSNGMTQYGPGGIGYPMGYDQPVPMPGISAGGKGGGMLEPAVTVTGSDGKMYGSPSAARAAGAYPESRSYDQPVPMPGISAGAKGGAKGGANPYSQIMGQNGGGDPYSQIMGQMPTLQNPYATSTNEPFGGYDPRIYNNAFVGSNSRLNLSGLIGGGDSGGREDDTTGTKGAPSVTFDADGNIVGKNVNANMVSGVAGLFGLLAGIPGLGFVGRELANRSNFANDQAAMFADVGIKDTSNPANLSGLLGQTATIGPTGTGGQASSAAASAAAAASAMGYSDAAIGAASQAAANAAIGGATAADAAAAGSAAAATVANDIDAASATQGISPGAGISDPGETASNAADAAAGSGSYTGAETSSGGEAYANFNGGLVSNVFGPNPPGPDDGAGMLQLGEYVIKKSAVDKYGTGLLNMINNGKIPAKKIKSLLG